MIAMCVRVNPVTKLCPQAAGESKANNYNFPSTGKYFGIYDRTLLEENSVVKARRSCVTVIIRVRRRTVQGASSDSSH